MTRKFAMLSEQGTACSETVLKDNEFTAENRYKIEAECCRGRHDDPIRGTWTDVSDNDAL